jgi:hypothetical protein
MVLGQGDEAGEIGRRDLAVGQYPSSPSSRESVARAGGPLPMGDHHDNILSFPTKKVKHGSVTEEFVK